MVYRKFHDLQLSGLGLGMMRLPVRDGDDGAVDEAAAAEMIDYAYHNGINYCLYNGVKTLAFRRNL